ncbi:MAG: cobalamin-dependent protein [Candidatus Eremiobacteraeota bacterium]|nr:cobalamin-dependent protein [Candidatus Eremiobacteraeota bacterium]
MSDITLVNTVLPSEVKVPPQGILYLTAALEAAGFDVDIRDYQLCEFDAPWEPATLARFVEGSAPVIGFSAMSYALPLVIATARLVKERAPEKIIVAGGIGPSGAGAPLLDYCPAIDVIVDGEGERTIVELMQAIRDGRELGSVAGIIHRAGGRARANAPRPRIASMVELAPPAYHRVDFSRYRLVDSQFGRGCPFRCTFCDIAPFWNRLNTHRPIEHYADELERLVNVHGARDVFIVDDTFVLARKSILQFCGEIERRGIEFEWGCYARVDLMDEELIERMAAAGCRKVFYGVESGSDAVLGEIVKDTTVQMIIDAVTRSLRHFSFVTASFMWGFPGESLDDLRQTVAFLLYLTSLGASPQLNLVLPYSYSTLYKQYRDQIRFDPRYSSQLQFYEGDDREWLCAMIAERPDLFSAFYQLPTQAFEEKWSYLEEIGLSPHELQYAYDHPVPAAR